jgi:hypothetical protein
MGGWGKRVATKRALDEEVQKNTGLLLVLATTLAQHHGGKLVLSDAVMNEVQQSIPSIGVEADKENGNYTVWLKRDGVPEQAPSSIWTRFWKTWVKG